MVIWEEKRYDEEKDDLWWDWQQNVKEENCIINCNV